MPNEPRNQIVEQATVEIQNLAAEDIGRIFNKRKRLSNILDGLWIASQPSAELTGLAENNANLIGMLEARDQQLSTAQAENQRLQGELAEAEESHLGLDKYRRKLLEVQDELRAAQAALKAAESTIKALEAKQDGLAEAVRKYNATWGASGTPARFSAWQEVMAVVSRIPAGQPARLPFYGAFTPAEAAIAEMRQEHAQNDPDYTGPVVVVMQSQWDRWLTALDTMEGAGITMEQFAANHGLSPSPASSPLELPDAEGWWWEWKFGNWSCQEVIAAKSDGLLVIAREGRLCERGRWFPCLPPEGTVGT